MVARKSLLAVGLLTLIVAVSFGSYASVGNQVPAKEDTTPPESTIEQHALGNNTTVESVTGTVTITTDRPDGNQIVEADIWQQTPDHVRYEYTDGPRAGTAMVSNGSDLWMYNDTTNTARHLRLDGENGGLIRNLSNAFPQVSDGFKADYQGTATVSGHETYVVSLQPKNESMQDMMGNTTVWLDQKNWFPVKERITTTVGNESTTTTMTNSNLAYNALIPDDRFTFTPPEDAHVIDVSLPQTSTYSSVDAARKAVDYTIREPSSVPNGYSLENVTVTTSNGNVSVSLEYTNGSETLTVSQMPATRARLTVTRPSRSPGTTKATPASATEASSSGPTGITATRSSGRSLRRNSSTSRNRSTANHPIAATVTTARFFTGFVKSARPGVCP